LGVDIDIAFNIQPSTETSTFPIRWNTVDVTDNYNITVGEYTMVKISDALPAKEDLEKLCVSQGGVSLSFKDYNNEMCIGDDVVTVYYDTTVYNDDGTHTWYYYPVTVVYKAGNYSGIEINETGLYVLDMYNEYQINVDYVIDYK
jgi:hypothetical protein